MTILRGAVILSLIFLVASMPLPQVGGEDGDSELLDDTGNVTEDPRSDSLAHEVPRWGTATASKSNGPFSQRGLRPITLAIPPLDLRNVQNIRISEQDGDGIDPQTDIPIPREPLSQRINYPPELDKRRSLGPNLGPQSQRSQPNVALNASGLQKLPSAGLEIPGWAQSQLFTSPFERALGQVQARPSDKLATSLSQIALMNQQSSYTSGLPRNFPVQPHESQSQSQSQSQSHRNFRSSQSPSGTTAEGLLGQLPPREARPSIFQPGPSRLGTTGAQTYGSQYFTGSQLPRQISSSQNQPSREVYHYPSSIIGTIREEDLRLGSAPAVNLGSDPSTINLIPDVDFNLVGRIAQDDEELFTPEKIFPPSGLPFSYDNDLNSQVMGTLQGGTNRKLGGQTSLNTDGRGFQPQRLTTSMQGNSSPSRKSSGNPKSSSAEELEWNTLFDQLDNEGKDGKGYQSPSGTGNRVVFSANKVLSNPQN